MIRCRALEALDEEPVILEGFGGYGALFDSCYAHVSRGVVFEKNPLKSAALAAQRPRWSVYEADVENALRGGAGSHLLVNFVDLDPYGSPWESMEAYFGSERRFAERLVVVVNDGLRQRVRFGGAWSVEALKPMVQKFGNNLHAKYLEVCRELLTEKAAVAGYRLDRFSGYYCGNSRASTSTHYYATLSKAA